MELIRSGLLGFITGIVLLVAIVFIFRRQVDKEKKNNKD